MNILGNFINGSFISPHDQSGGWIVRSPADLGDELGQFSYSYASVDSAVESSRFALKSWKGIPQTERAEVLKKCLDIIRKRSGGMTEIVAREIGKPLWDVKTEIDAALDEADVNLRESTRFVTDFSLRDILPGVTGVCRHRPVGVMAVIGPFNSPVHMPMRHIFPALFAGNTVVFKPSEKAPFSGQLLAECFLEAGIPAGVFNMIQGEKEVGRRLCVNESVSGVLFTGSYETGTRIKQDTLQQHWKLLVLEMGGKNPAIIWKDADLEAALHDVLVGAFQTTGQNGTATSRVLVHSQIFETFIGRLHERSKAISVGHPLENPFMGPLIDQTSMDRYTKFMGISAREGCEIIMRGKQLSADKKGYYVSPSICLVNDASLTAAKKSVYQQTEIFGPNIAVLRIEDLDEAIALANVTQYGLVASVFSSSRNIYERCMDNLEMGQVNWNRATTVYSPRLPFGGLKKSGNYFPTALSASRYCAYPVSSLEADKPIGPSDGRYMGLNWK